MTMTLVASLLVTASAAIVFVLGALHLFHTFRSPGLLPRDASVKEAMERSSPRITRETTMWRAYIGLNVTHSMCLLLFGLIYAWFALTVPGLLFGSLFLRGLGLVLLVAFVVLARLYFFSVPFRAVVLATALYVAGLLVDAV
jgi:hypothetical protein